MALGCGRAWAVRAPPRTRHPGGCRGVACVAGLGKCASLRTLGRGLSWRAGVVDVAGRRLGQCASLQPLDPAGFAMWSGKSGRGAPTARAR